MRVVSGKARGTKLLSVPGETTRPILDRVKTALFDYLRPRLENTIWLDLFAGSGSVGIEALSQGAKECVFVDVEPKAAKIIRANLEATKFAAVGEVRQTDAFLYLRKTDRKFDFIFVAPPQYQSLWVQAVHSIAERPELVTPTGCIIVQIDPKEYEELNLADFAEVDKRRYGNSILLFFSKNSAD